MADAHARLTARYVHTLVDILIAAEARGGFTRRGSVKLLEDLLASVRGNTPDAEAHRAVLRAARDELLSFQDE